MSRWFKKRQPPSGSGGEEPTFRAAGAITEGMADEGDALKWASRYRTGDSGRPARIGLRLAVFFNVFLLICLVLALDTFRMIFPLQRTVPQIMTVRGPDDILVRVEGARLDGPGARWATERLVLTYVRFRYEFIPDPTEMERRWGVNPPCLSQPMDPVFDDGLCAYMRKRTDVQPYVAFTEVMRPLLSQWIEAGISRTVEFTVDPVWRDNSHIEVRFLLREQQRGRVIRETHMQVNVRFSLGGSQEVPRAERYLNPEAFRVIGIQEAEIADPRRGGAQR